MNPKPKHMQVEIAYTKSRTRTRHPYMNVMVPSVISQHSPHEEQHDRHFVLKLLLNIRDASNFRKWTVCSVQWLSQLLKRGKKKKKTVTNGRICQNILALCTCSRRKKCVHILGMDNFWMAARDCRKVSFWSETTVSIYLHKVLLF